MWKILAYAYWPTGHKSFWISFKFGRAGVKIIDSWVKNVQNLAICWDISCDQPTGHNSFWISFYFGRGLPLGEDSPCYVFGQSLSQNYWLKSQKYENFWHMLRHFIFDQGHNSFWGGLATLAGDFWVKKSLWRLNGFMIWSWSKSFIVIIHQGQLELYRNNTGKMIKESWAWS